MSRNFTYKIILAGESQVGKTTLVNRYIHNKFMEDFKRTIGVDIYVKGIRINGDLIRIQIWDLGGEERFRMVLPNYLQRVAGVLFLFDLSDLNSLNRIGDWYDVIRSESPLSPLLLVGAKSDLYTPSDKSIRMINIAREHYNFFSYLESSSKLGINVEESFEILTRHIHFEVISRQMHDGIRIFD